MLTFGIQDQDSVSFIVQEKYLFLFASRSDRRSDTW